MINYYEILELEDYSSVEEVETAYLELSEKYRNGDPVIEEKFEDIRHAYERLRDPENKELYDDDLYYYNSEPYDALTDPYVPVEPRNRIKWTPKGVTMFLLLSSLIIRSYTSTYTALPVFVEVKQEGTDTAFNRAYFSSEGYIQKRFKLGDSQQMVQDIQGAPSQILKYQDEEMWSYGNSSVTFKNGVVSKFSNADKNLKIVQ